MAAKTLEDLFKTTLKDVYHAEKQIVKFMPKMAKKAETPELRTALENHMEETYTQIERLEQVFEMLGMPAKGKTCDAMVGLIEEAKEVMDEAESPEVCEAGLIAANQAVEHYEISRYGTLATWAEQLGMRDAAKLLTQTLEEEKKTDQLLSKIALQAVNQKAA